MAMTPEEQSYLGYLEREIKRMRADMTSLKVQGDKPSSLPGQYAGKPIPSRIGDEITIPAASTARSQSNIVIAADGPFCATSIHFAVRDQTGANLGQWRQISSIHDATLAAASPVDFYWEYQVSGSHRDRQNVPVPSSLIDRAEEGNGFFEFSIQDVFAKTSTVTIWVTPTVQFNGAAACTVWCGFSGFYILE